MNERQGQARDQSVSRAASQAEERRRIEARGVGTVYLVGAGPGDVGLMTVKGMQLLRQADVVIHGHLVSPKFFEYIREDAERIAVSRRKGSAACTHGELGGLMVERARQGKTVVRLKSGDPCFFGRISEEIEALAAAGVPYEIVPGVSSISAAPAYAGIPLTHRGHSSSVGIITGHEISSVDTHRWEHLAKAFDTLVILMGLKSLANIVEQLLKHGRAPDTPVALIRWGTTARQQTLLATLNTVVKECERTAVEAPAVIVIGEVARYHETLNWFETKPLFGRRIVVTRPRGEAGSFARGLERHGAEAVLCPVIEPEPMGDYRLLDGALQQLESYDWLIFTSVHGVRYFVERLWHHGLDLRAIGRAKLCAIGPKTAAELEALRLRVDLVPDEYRAESVLDAFGDDVSGLRLLLPRAEVAREILPETLRARGAIIDVVPAYRTTAPGARTDDQGPEHQAIVHDLEEGRIDAVTFTSSSTVTNFLALLPGQRTKELLAETVLASIGPITSETLSEHGLVPTVTAREFTTEGLTQALLEYFELQPHAQPLNLAP